MVIKYPRNPVVPTYIVGNWYRPSYIIGAGSGAALATGTLYITAFKAGETHIFDRIGINVTVGGTNIRLGIYELKTNKLIYDSGSIAASGTGDIAATISQKLQKNKWYYLVIEVDAAITVSFGVSSQSVAIFGGSTTGNTYFGRGQLNRTYGALPASLPTITWSTSGPPLICLRA